jgi:hypothetical protein
MAAPVKIMIKSELMAETANPTESNLNLLSPEFQAYKEKTLRQLQANRPLLENRLPGETRPEVIHSIRTQLEDIEAHIDLLQRELNAGVAGQPTADELCKRVAEALVKEKFFMAKKYVAKLETIEPFYPGLDRLREETETGRISRKTRSIAQGSGIPYGAAAFPPGQAVSRGGKADTDEPLPAWEPAAPDKRGRLAQLLQFHYIASCLVIMLISCVMLGVGGMMVLQYLIEGS